MQLCFTQGINAGKIKNIVVDQIETIEMPLAHVIPKEISGILLTLSVFVYLRTIDFRLALPSLITVPLGTIFCSVIQPPQKRR